jgi:hypothetical protein
LKRLPTTMEMIAAMPTGKIRLASSVSSIMTVARKTVIRPDPPKNEAMPTTAYIPGSGMAHSRAAQRYT